MFVGKTNTGSFNDVAPDMKLEQTIQRSKKGAGGIIGQTKRSPFVSERELVYHEILGISNSFSEIIKPGKLSDIDLNLHHELSGGYSKLFSEWVQKIVTFINEKGNTFKKKSSVSLFNFCTRQTVLPEVSKKLLDYFIHGNEEFKKIRHNNDLLKNQSC